MQGLARSTDPATAQRAAAGLKPSRKASLHDRICRHFDDGPDTVRAMAEALEEDQQSVTPRMQELLEAGRLVPMPRRETNRATNSEAQLWRRTKPAEQAAIVRYLGDTKVVAATTLLDRLMKEAGKNAALRDALNTHLPVELRRQINAYKRKLLFKQKVRELGLKRFLAEYDQ